MYMLFLPMLYGVICVCIDLCTLCENNKKRLKMDVGMIQTRLDGLIVARVCFEFYVTHIP